MRTLPSPSPMTSGGLFPLLLFSGSFHRLRRFPYTRVPFSILWKTLSRALFLFLTANFSSPVLWKWKVKVLVTQSSPTLCDPVDGSSSGSSVHWILQARVLEWVAIPYSSPSDLPDPGTEPGSPALQADSLLSEPHNIYIWLITCGSKCITYTYL